MLLMQQSRVCIGLLRAGADTLGLGMGERGDAQDADQHFPAQGGEERIAFVGEALENNERALVKPYFLHNGCKGTEKSVFRQTLLFIL